MSTEKNVYSQDDTSYPVINALDCRIMTWYEIDDDVHGFKARTVSFLQYLADKKSFKPNPPIIISPMPDYLKGRFTHFLYNGHRRLLIAKKNKLKLNAISANSIDDIPENSRLFNNNKSYFTPNQLLTEIICKKINAKDKKSNIEPSKRGDYSSRYCLESLTAKFKKYEEFF
jgi:hypothetical protein